MTTMETTTRSDRRVGCRFDADDAALVGAAGEYCISAKGLAHPAPPRRQPTSARDDIYEGTRSENEPPPPPKPPELPVKVQSITIGLLLFRLPIPPAAQET